MAEKEKIDKDLGVEDLPGIGPKSAQRLTFHLLHFPQEHLDRFSDSLKELKNGTQLCSVCKNVGEDTVCAICADSSRNSNQIMVLANPMDAFAVENTGYRGVTTLEALKLYEQRPILIVAAEKDTYAADSSRTLNSQALGQHRLQIYPNADHGTDILIAQAGLQPMMLSWFGTTLQ